MKILLSIVIIFLGFISHNDCVLKGEYRMIVDKRFNRSIDFIIDFNDSIYVKTSAFGVNKGKISTFIGSENKCFLYLEDDEFIKPELNTKIDSMLYSMGKVLIEIEGPLKDTIKFRRTYSRQLHVTIDSGILVKN